MSIDRTLTKFPLPEIKDRKYFDFENYISGHINMLEASFTKYRNMIMTSTDRLSVISQLITYNENRRKSLEEMKLKLSVTRSLLIYPFAVKKGAEIPEIQDNIELIQHIREGLSDTCDIDLLDKHILNIPIDMQKELVIGFYKFDEFEDDCEYYINMVIYKLDESGLLTKDLNIYINYVLILIIEFNKYKVDIMGLSRVLHFTNIFGINYEIPVQPHDYSASHSFSDDIKTSSYNDMLNYLYENIWPKEEKKLRANHSTPHAIAVEIGKELKRNFPNAYKYPSNSWVRNKIGMKNN
jgi:hypothetical protein